MWVGGFLFSFDFGFGFDEGIGVDEEIERGKSGGFRFLAFGRVGIMVFVGRL